MSCPILPTLVLGFLGVANLLAACDGAEVMIGCRPAGAARLTVAAAGARGEVFRDTGSGVAASHLHNGVQFYFDEDSSIGFAPAGAAVSRTTCDVNALPAWGNADDWTGDGRMCWHTSAGVFDEGFRCGLDVSYEGAFDRLVYTR